MSGDDLSLNASVGPSPFPPPSSPQGEDEAAGEAADEACVRRALAGDETAWREMMDRYGPMVMGYLLGRTRDDNDREELLQGVFVRAFQALGSLRDASRLGPWLLRIAERETAEFYRARERSRQRGGVGAGDAADHAAKLADSRPGPYELTHAAEIARLVMQAIARLGDHYRVVLYLRLIEEETPQRIARRLGLRESATRMRLKRGLELLRRELRRLGIHAP